MLSQQQYDLTARITLFSTELGGRRNPVWSGYRPNFAFNSKKYYCGQLKLIDKKELRPGESSKASIKLLPAWTIRKTLKPNDAFTITEGTKVIGTGVIEKSNVGK